MKIKKIKEEIKKISKPDEGYSFFQHDSFFWGYDSEMCLSFGTFSTKSDHSMISSTKALKVQYRKLHKIKIDDKEYENDMNIITLKHGFDDFTDTFLNLTLLFSSESETTDFATFFKNLATLFSNNQKTSYTALEGLYGELLTIYYFMENYNFDLVPFYEGSLRQLFDFSLSDNKKIEVKSTTKNERIHHFKLSQIDSRSLKILVVSIMLERDDEVDGFSLSYLIDYFNNLSPAFLTSFAIYTEIKNYRDEELQNFKFNSDLALESLKVYYAKDVPSAECFNQNVQNVNFDSNLSKLKSVTDDEIKQWLETV